MKRQLANGIQRDYKQLSNDSEYEEDKSQMMRTKMMMKMRKKNKR